uniref:Uncharacterized protein n=1 Tax=Octactis speculum TaxID=3111310 RepID=A0A7S2GGR7_9STRA|mmetsp:Transcript_46977/g.63936  ORF Transcript_46977/g.63936 Transcript_46977/m.63936 type:complete len:187 (+) Transcript_46977:18-578(+)
MWVFQWLQELIASFLLSLGIVDKEATIILIGLDNAGKTTLLHKLSKGVFGSFPPTEKRHQDKFKVGGVQFQAWDLGGHEAVRYLWDDWLPSAGGIVFMVDGADSDRLAECEEELAALAKNEELFGVPIVVLFNKVDLSYALSDEELYVALNWEELRDREGPIMSFRTSIRDGTGYTQGIQWLAQNL